jgi:hypothetical protein
MSKLPNKHYFLRLCRNWQLNIMPSIFLKVSKLSCWRTINDIVAKLAKENVHQYTCPYLIIKIAN